MKRNWFSRIPLYALDDINKIKDFRVPTIFMIFSIVGKICLLKSLFPAFIMLGAIFMIAHNFYMVKNFINQISGNFLHFLVFSIVQKIGGIVYIY